MLKRHGSSEKQTKKRHCLSLAFFLPHDVVELILERLPVKSLLRFISVSHKWKSTIESRRFQEGHLICRKQATGPDVLVVSLCDKGDARPSLHVRTVKFDLEIECRVTFPFSGSITCYGSCDGLVCLYCLYTPNVVFNPATKWHRSFPLSSYQHLLIDMNARKDFWSPNFRLGLGRDKFRGTYKPVWLYNSSENGLDPDNVTTCELFDFSTNAWRYVLPASPYRISAYHKPVYLDGSLYWLTECEYEETKVLSFDLHTETFHVLCNAPFAHLYNPRNATICILNGRLCVSLKKWPNQIIWSFDSSSGSKKWKRMCSIDLTKATLWFWKPESALSPIAILEKKKLLLQGPQSHDRLVIYNLRRKSFQLFYKTRFTKPVGPVYYFQSLFSAF